MWAHVVLACAVSWQLYGKMHFHISMYTTGGLSEEMALLVGLLSHYLGDCSCYHLLTLQLLSFHFQTCDQQFMVS